MFSYNSGNLFESLATGFIYIGLYMLNFVISLGIFILTTILGIINYKKTYQAIVKKKIIVLLAILGVFHTAVLIFTIISMLLA